MYRLNVRKLMMLLTFCMLVMAALAAGSQPTSACYVNFPPDPPC